MKFSRFSGGRTIHIIYLRKCIDAVLQNTTYVKNRKIYMFLDYS